MGIQNERSEAIKIDTCYRCIERKIEGTTGRKPGNSLLNDIEGLTHNDKQESMFKGCIEERSFGRCDLEKIGEAPVSNQRELASRFCQGVMRDMHRV